MNGVAWRGLCVWCGRRGVAWVAWGGAAWRGMGGVAWCGVGGVAWVAWVAWMVWVGGVAYCGAHVTLHSPNGVVLTLLC